jgi:Protein of unknown function (DUF3866)
MASFATGVVLEIIETHDDLVRVLVDADGGTIPAAGFPRMLGPVEVGDEVVINTTGVALGLGTGGEAFILWNLTRGAAPGVGPGHIVKMRYTPWQTEVLAVEAQESPHHEAMVDADSIAGLPVIACGLHSQIAAVAGGIKAEAPDAKVGYLMTDGAALPLAWSNLVRSLKDASLIDITATSGHSFGGDLEVVNLFSGMVALDRIANVDVIIVAMGPGVVGTGTALGFTAIEQAQVLDAAAVLGGLPVACLRINLSDVRPRHKGLSHHTITSLRLVSRSGVLIPLPDLGPEHNDRLTAALDFTAAAGHSLFEVDGAPGLAELKERGVEPRSMGKGVDEIPELFLAASAAGRSAGMARVAQVTTAKDFERYPWVHDDHSGSAPQD